MYCGSWGHKELDTTEQLNCNKGDLYAWRHWRTRHFACAFRGSGGREGPRKQGLVITSQNTG